METLEFGDMFGLQDGALQAIHNTGQDICYVDVNGYHWGNAVQSMEPEPIEMSSFLRSHTETLNKEFAAMLSFIEPSFLFLGVPNTYCISWNVNYGLSPNITSLPTLH